MQEILIYDIEQSLKQEQNGDGDGEEKIQSKKQQKQTEISEMLHTKIIKVSEKKMEKQIENMKIQTTNNENIFFYEEEATHPSQRQEYDQTDRYFLQKQMNNLDSESIESSQQIDSEEDYEQKRQRNQTKKLTKKQQVVISAKVQNLIKQPVPLGYKLKCVIKTEAGLIGTFIYRLFLVQSKQFLLSAKKQRFKLLTNFIICNSYNQIHKRDENYLGRLSSNFIGTEFRYFDTKGEHQQIKTVINYHKNIMGLKGPRSMRVVKAHPKKKIKFGHDLDSLIEGGQKSKLIQLETVRPKFENGKYKISFGKKVLPSSKNFILGLQQKQALLFAKISETSYLLEVSYPFNLIESFAIALTSLESKLLVN